MQPLPGDPAGFLGGFLSACYIERVISRGGKLAEPSPSTWDAL
jgi:hypothetical protein